MPKGNPNPQTIATAKYQKKAGIVAKSFKVRKDLADAFAEACKEAGVSQAGQISAFMAEFAEERGKRQNKDSDTY